MTTATLKPDQMVVQAIITKYIAPSNTKGGRIKATAAAGSVTIPYPHEVSGIEGSHAVAALALANKMGWDGEWIQGGSPDSNGYVFVCLERTWRATGAQSADHPIII